MLPTYQKEGENESLLMPQTVPMLSEETTHGFWTKTNKTRAGVVMVVGMIVAAFAVRSELYSQKSVVYSPSVDGMMQSNSPLMGSSPVYVEPSNVVIIDTENVMIAGNPLPGVVTQHPESTETTSSGIMTSGSDLSGTNTGASLIQKVAAAAATTTATTEVTTTATTPVVPVVATSPTVGVDPNAPIPKTIILGDPNHPAPAKTVPMVIPVTEAADITKPVNDVANIKSDTRLSPLFMSSHTDTNGMLRTFFSKYGFVGNRLTDKEKYHIPTAVLSADVKGDAATWAYATMTTGGTCQGSTVSVAGLAGQQCIPVAGYGGTTSQAFMIDCANNEVVLNGYSAQDCSGAVTSSAVLASTGTCYAYSSTMYENPSDTPLSDTASTSVTFTCGTPNLSGYDVEKVYITADDSAQSTCNLSSSTAYDGQMFEALPTNSCIAESLGDDNSYSLMFSKDDGENPQVTYYFSTTTCDTTAKTSTASLYTDCEDQGLQTGISSYAKWAYHA